VIEEADSWPKPGCSAAICVRKSGQRPNRTFEKYGDFVDEAAAANSDADGVLVVSAWRRGVADRLLARITMSSGGSVPVVRVVSDPSELHAAIDEWLASLEG
jgi:hypothetical protein